MNTVIFNKSRTSIVVILAIMINVLSAVPTTFRAWGTGSLNLMVNPGFGFTIMPCLRYEFVRADNSQRLPARGFYFIEFLTGPFLMKKLQSFVAKLPVHYYYMGFPVRDPQAYYYSHNINLAPAVEYRQNRFSTTGRMILVNTFYASVYTTNSERWGYSMLLRAMLQAGYTARRKVSLYLSDEPFIGLITDSQAPANAAGYPARGLLMNRINLSVEIRFRPSFVLTPQYIFETCHDAERRIIGVNHNVMLTLVSIVKM